MFSVHKLLITNMARESILIFRQRIDLPRLIGELNAALSEEWLAFYQYWIGAQVVEGQNGTIEDVGNYSPILNEDGDPVDPKTGEIRKYGPEDIQFSEKLEEYAEEIKKELKYILNNGFTKPFKEV